jgi:hypothetical protein
MKAQGILFKGAMIRALLNTQVGVWPPQPIDSAKPYKGQTRRIVDPQPGDVFQHIIPARYHPSKVDKTSGEIYPGPEVFGFADDEQGWVCPYPPGTILYAKETFSTLDCHHGQMVYRADGDQNLTDMKWKPSIFMPKTAARLWFEVVNVRVERVSQISHADARLEGVSMNNCQPLHADGKCGQGFSVDWVSGYRELWDSGIGVRSNQKETYENYRECNPGRMGDSNRRHPRVRRKASSLCRHCRRRRLQGRGRLRRGRRTRRRRIHRQRQPHCCRAEAARLLQSRAGRLELSSWVASQRSQAPRCTGASHQGRGRNQSAAMNFFQRTQSFPPILLRLLARHKGGKPLTCHEIAERSGQPLDICNTLSTMEVMEMAKQTNWKGIGALEMFSFMRGCNLMLDDTATMRRVSDYLRKNPNFEYLRVSPDWESYYKPLMIIWRSSYGDGHISGQPLPTYPPVRELVKRLTPIMKKP